MIGITSLSASEHRWLIRSRALGRCRRICLCFMLDESDFSVLRLVARLISALVDDAFSQAVRSGTFVQDARMCKSRWRVPKYHQRPDS